jgi:hypothetical protein
VRLHIICASSADFASKSLNDQRKKGEGTPVVEKHFCREGRFTHNGNGSDDTDPSGFPTYRMEITVQGKI